MSGKNYAKKRLHNATKKGCISPMCSKDLTPTEQEVLYLLTDEFLTPKQIQQRRQISHQAVYKIIGNLRKKGAFNSGMVKVAKLQRTMQPCNQKIRLHGQEFNIKILHMDQRYQQALERSNLLVSDGNTIRLYKDSIEVYSGHDFTSDDVQKATAKSFVYWNRFFARLEHDLKVILIKPNSQNIKLVNQHYAETNNEFSKECERKGDHVRIYTKEDGKLWFVIDNSFNLHEAESLHPKTAKQDMEGVKSFFNDLRARPVTLSQIKELLHQSAEINKETASGLNVVADLVRAQLPQQQKGEEQPKGVASYIG